MSTFTRAAVTSQQLSLVAMEEASRQGLREADLDHLLLALVISEQSAGQALRRLGITQPAARDAVEAQHSAQLASLGIDPAETTSGPIVFHKTSGYEWSKRAGDLMVRASGKKKKGDAAAVLRELVSEPSGLIVQILQRLGTTPASVLDALTEVERAETERGDGEDSGTATPRRAASRGETTVSVTSFVPARAEDIWALISDPLRMPEWHPAVGRVDATPLPGTTEQWTGYAHSTRPDGKPIRMKEKYVRRDIERVSAIQPTSVVWRMSMPDAPPSVVRELTLDVTSAEGGATLRLTEVAPASRGWRRVVWAPLRPVRRFVSWLTLFQAGGGVSRVFRA